MVRGFRWENFLSFQFVTLIKIVRDFRWETISFQFVKLLKIVRDFRWETVSFFLICDTSQGVGCGKVWRSIFLSRKQFWCSVCAKGNYST